MTTKEQIEGSLEIIKKKNGELNAFLEVFDDVWGQYEVAKDKAPLFGLPIAIKDNILINGKRASASSKIIENFVSPYDATVIKKLREILKFLLGKENLLLVWL